MDSAPQSHLFFLQILISTRACYLFSFSALIPERAIAGKIQNMSILYVDDDPEDIEIFQDAIKNVDPSIQILTAGTAADAFVLLNSTRSVPDHMILDINLPGMDGKRCLQEIRKEKRFDAINIIIYSTNSFPGDIREIECLKASFVKKANSFNDLCQMIRDLRAYRRAVH